MALASIRINAVTAGQSVLGLSANSAVTLTDFGGAGATSYAWVFLQVPGPYVAFPTINNSTSQVATVPVPGGGFTDGLYVVKLTRTDVTNGVTTDIRTFGIGDSDGLHLPTAGVNRNIMNIGGSAAAQTSGWFGSAQAGTNTMLDAFLRLRRQREGRFIGKYLNTIAPAGATVVQLDPSKDPTFREITLQIDSHYTIDLLGAPTESGTAVNFIVRFNSGSGNYTASIAQTDYLFVVPIGVTYLTYVVDGGGGGGGGLSDTPPGGRGGRCTGTLTVTPGETLKITVGGGGISPIVPDGGPGGGRSSIFRGTAPLVIAGGGGGGSEDTIGGNGGHGGGGLSLAGLSGGGPNPGLGGNNGVGGAGGGNGLSGTTTTGGIGGEGDGVGASPGTAASPHGFGGAGGLGANGGGGGGGGYGGGGGGRGHATSMSSGGGGGSLNTGSSPGGSVGGGPAGGTYPVNGVDGSVTLTWSSSFTVRSGYGGAVVNSMTPPGNVSYSLTYVYGNAAWVLKNYESTGGPRSYASLVTSGGAVQSTVVSDLSVATASRETLVNGFTLGAGATGPFTYTGTSTKVFKVDVSASLETGSGTSIIVITKNGIATAAQSRASANPAAGVLSCSTLVSLNLNDTIWFTHAPITATNYNVGRFSATITEV